MLPWKHDTHVASLIFVQSLTLQHDFLTCPEWALSKDFSLQIKAQIYLQAAFWLLALHKPWSRHFNDSSEEPVTNKDLKVIGPNFQGSHNFLSEFKVGVGDYNGEWAPQRVWRRYLKVGFVDKNGIIYWVQIPPFSGWFKSDNSWIRICTGPCNLLFWCKVQLSTQVCFRLVWSVQDHLVLAGNWFLFFYRNSGRVSESVFLRRFL